MTIYTCNKTSLYVSACPVVWTICLSISKVSASRLWETPHEPFRAHWLMSSLWISMIPFLKFKTGVRLFSPRLTPSMWKFYCYRNSMKFSNVAAGLEGSCIISNLCFKVQKHFVSAKQNKLVASWKWKCDKWSKVGPTQTTVSTLSLCIQKTKTQRNNNSHSEGM